MAHWSPLLRSEAFPEGVPIERRAALAGFVLSGVLLTLALPGGHAVFEPCPQPEEFRAVQGHTTAVRCDRAASGKILRGPARRLFGLAIDPNCADAATLETLPEIGPARALAILRERDRRPFASVDELRRVPGIGPKTLERVRSALAVAFSSPEGDSAYHPACGVTETLRRAGASGARG